MKRYRIEYYDRESKNWIVLRCFYTKMGMFRWFNNHLKKCNVLKRVDLKAEIYGCFKFLNRNTEIDYEKRF